MTTSAIPEDHLQLLRAAGVETIQHDSHIPFLAHLAGVRRLLVEWKASQELQNAGLFHSIYGTEFFDPELGGKTPSREKVQSVIGERAERIAWLWCHTRRETIPDSLAGGEPHTIENRNGSREPVTIDEARDLAELWCADAVEQGHRLSKTESDYSRGLVRVLSHVSNSARAAVETMIEEIESRG